MQRTGHSQYLRRDSPEAEIPSFSTDRKTRTRFMRTAAGHGTQTPVCLCILYSDLIRMNFLTGVHAPLHSPYLSIDSTRL
ncbi:hypothetical protein D3C71_858960 [compost metagenome]